MASRFQLLLTLTALTAVFSLATNQAAQVARISSSAGEFDIELFSAETPLTAGNFLNYARSGRYDSSIIHRSVPGFVVQGGGYGLNGTNLYKIPTDAPVTNEPGISNLRGTVAMAKLGGNPNSATSEWFINLGNNSANLDAQNGGFTVFGELIGNGMAVADRIAGYGVYNASAQLGSAFGELPLLAPSLALIQINKVRNLPSATIVKEYDFSSDSHGFVGSFADLPANYDTGFYQLMADHRALPPELGNGKGLFLSGWNHSDDLWMAWKKKITGLEPNTLYEVVVDIEMASNVPAGLIGVGGSPGESVFLKAGASGVEPIAVVDSEAMLRWNIDKGNQAIGGTAASVLGNIAKEDETPDSFVRIFRDNRSAKLTATSAADGSLWLFFGTDSGFESTTEVYFTRVAAVFGPVTVFPVGEFLGNFQADSLRGRLSLKLDKSGAFTGSLMTPLGTSRLSGKFDDIGNATVSIGQPAGTMNLTLHAGGLSDGEWDAGDSVSISGVLKFGDEEASFVCRPAPRKGGPPVPLVGSRINTLFESLGKSGVDFGHGFAGAVVSKDGTVKISGSLADGTKISGSARMVEDGAGGWKLPVGLPLAATKGFLHGEAAVASEPGAGEFHLESSAPWRWIRPPNPKAKSFAAGFQEELDVKGRMWSWTKGTSVLGGAGGNSTLDLSFGDHGGGFVPAAGLGNLQGRLGADNKPVWSAGSTPKGFSMIITPATGLFSGKIPGTQKGKPATVSYQGVLFPADLTIGTDGSVRGAGFVFSKETLGAAVIALD
jgi:cyclophilin family peptidyl-prolyl cis-trans isomerase